MIDKLSPSRNSRATRFRREYLRKINASQQTLNIQELYIELRQIQFAVGCLGGCCEIRDDLKISVKEALKQFLKK